ncbi:hypothetical protein TWF696_004075 [Orbilia brochopaga]|uniref:Uncharacterized protein n=1 Tax=Orbilia brochopaga TaxID=3140254 RepID=A0AAV9V7Q3_9PEZI
MQAALAINFPVVPPGEEDPRVRINTMIKIFNQKLPQRPNPNPASMDMGLFYEIKAAIKLVRARKITHGKEISRGLTKHESEVLGLNGASQMVKVPLPGNRFRELDIVYGGNNIVEVKDKRVLDATQMEKNVKLASTLGGSLSYALPTPEGKDKPNSASAYETAFKEAREKVYQEDGIQTNYSLGIIAVPSEDFAKNYWDGIVSGLAQIATQAELDKEIDENEDSSTMW